MKKQFLGKIVQIYPGDTYTKFGEVVDINEAGVTFRITKSQARDLSVDEVVFYAFSNKLTFKLAE